MQRSKILILAAATALAACGVAQAAQKASVPPKYVEVPIHPGTMPPPRTSGAPDAKRGYIVYASQGCWQCHGTTGETGGPGPRLAPNPLPIEAVTKQLRTPSARMPVYTAAVLSDNDIADLYAYLQSAKPAKAVADIPLLNSNYNYAK